MTEDEIQKNSKEFYDATYKKPIDEQKLLDLIDKGIDIHYRDYWEGHQRFDDGNYWGSCGRLITRALYVNSAKVMEKLLEQPGVERELHSGDTCVHWSGKEHSRNAAWLRDIFYYLYDTKPTEFDKTLPVVLASPKLTDYRLLKEGFKYLPQEIADKFLHDDNLDEDKLDALMAARRFTISKKEDFDLLPKYKKAESFTIKFGELSNEDVLHFLSEISENHLRSLKFENFPTKESQQEPIVKMLSYFKMAQPDWGEYKFEATDADGKEIELSEMINKEKERQASAEHEGQPQWKIDFYKAVATRRYYAAVDILKEQGLFKQKVKVQTSQWGREFDLSPIGWGHNYLDVYDDLVGVDVKDLGNNVVAVGQIYEDRHWSSHGADPNPNKQNGIGWYWNASVALVDLDKGVGPTAKTGTLCVRDPGDVSRDIFGNIPREDFVSVQGNKVFVRMGGYASACLAIPKNDGGHGNPDEQDPQTPKKIASKSVRKKDPKENDDR